MKGLSPVLGRMIPSISINPARNSQAAADPSSGGARWAYLAAWGYALQAPGGDQEKAARLLLSLLKTAHRDIVRIPVELATGGSCWPIRLSTEEFLMLKPRKRAGHLLT